MLADVNHLEIRIALHLLLHILAVWAGLHHIHLNHSLTYSVVDNLSNAAASSRYTVHSFMGTAPSDR